MAAEDGEPTYQVQYKGEDKAHPNLSKNGVARATFANGDVFEGEYANGKRNGKGVYTFKRGGSYEGTYADNKKDGEGTLTAPDGSKYVGQWKNDKRHGTGTYFYANGDRYIGGWRNGAKHGHGTYVYAAVHAQLSAEWSNGQAQNGVWTTHDGTKFSGSFLSNTPNGTGVFQFANGNSEAGRFDVKAVPLNDDAPEEDEKKTVHQWTKEDRERVHPDSAPPAVVDVEPLKRAGRAIDKAVLKVDHFEAIYRLEKRFEGVPNFRKVDATAGAAGALSYPIYGSGQPSVTGFVAVLSDILSGGAIASGAAAASGAEPEDISKVVWVNMRQEPVIYVNNMSYAPRDLKALNENMEFPGVDSAMLSTLEQRMSEALRKKTFAAGGIHTYYKDTFAENPADRKNLVLTEDVPLSKPLEQSVRPIAAVYQELLQEKNIEVEYKRLPIVDERSPTPADFDLLVEVLRSACAEEKTAVYFNCQMGKGRTTTGMVCAVLMKRVLDPNHKEPDPADYNEAIPDLAAGQYKCIMKLLEAITKTSGAAAPTPPDASATATASASASATAAAPDSKSAPAADANGSAADAKGGGGGGGSGAHKENGEFVKAEVDDAMDKCKAMQHLRTCIIEAKDKFTSETTAARKAFWKTMAQNFLERYFFLILFNAYLRDAGRPKRPEKKKKKPAAPPAAAPAVVVDPPAAAAGAADGGDAKSGGKKKGKGKAAAKSKSKAAKGKGKKRAGDSDDDNDDDDDAEDGDEGDAEADAEAAAAAEEERRQKAAEEEAERKAAEEAEEAEEEAREAERWEEIKSTFVPFSAITFSKWLAARPHLLAILGTRQAGALADFNWA